MATGAKPRARTKAATGPLERVRKIALALPDTIEKEAWQTPTFRAGGRMFAMYVDDHHGDGRVAVWCKAPAGVQEILVGAAPERFFVPPYVGPNGWIGVRLDVGDLDWDEVAEHLAEAHRASAATRKKPARPSAAKKPSSSPARRKRAGR